MQSRTSRPLRVDLPAEVWSSLGSTPEEAAVCLKWLGLIELYRRGEVSTGYPAQILGISRWEFIRLLDEHGIPHLQLSEEALKQDLEALRPLRNVDPGQSSRTADR